MREISENLESQDLLMDSYQSNSSGFCTRMASHSMGVLLMSISLVIAVFFASVGRFSTENVSAAVGSVGMLFGVIGTYTWWWKRQAVVQKNSGLCGNYAHAEKNSFLYVPPVAMVSERADENIEKATTTQEVPMPLEI